MIRRCHKLSTETRHICSSRPEASKSSKNGSKVTSSSSRISSDFGSADLPRVPEHVRARRDRVESLSHAPTGTAGDHGTGGRLAERSWCWVARNSARRRNGVAGADPGRSDEEYCESDRHSTEWQWRIQAGQVRNTVSSDRHSTEWQWRAQAGQMRNTVSSDRHSTEWQWRAQAGQMRNTVSLTDTARSGSGGFRQVR